MGKEHSYRDDSWVDPCLELRASPIDKVGIFTNKFIKEGEIVTIWGGTIFTTKDVLNGRAKENCFAEIGEGVYIGTMSDDEPSLDDFINHSCDPNVWLTDEVTLAAKRLINRDEELTIDYSTFSASMLDGYSYFSFKCKCGLLSCRGLVTPDDWKLPDLQKRYRGHFSPYINKRILSLQI